MDCGCPGRTDGARRVRPERWDEQRSRAEPPLGEGEKPKRPAWRGRRMAAEERVSQEALRGGDWRGRRERA